MALSFFKETETPTAVVSILVAFFILISSILALKVAIDYLTQDRSTLKQADPTLTTAILLFSDGANEINSDVNCYVDSDNNGELRYPAVML